MKVIKLYGSVLAIGPGLHNVNRGVVVHNYIHIKTDNGVVKINKTHVFDEVDSNLKVGASGMFLFAKSITHTELFGIRINENEAFSQELKAPIKVYIFQIWQLIMTIFLSIIVIGIPFLIYTILWFVNEPINYRKKKNALLEEGFVLDFKGLA
jgi:hypothetical protein